MRSLFVISLLLRLLQINAHLTPNDLDTLSRQLSTEVEIHDQNSPYFSYITAHHNSRIQPQIDIAVEAVTVSDVRSTISFARSQNRPLIIRTTGHGKSQRLSDSQSGVQLSLRKFNSIKINPSANIAILGAGVINSELVAALWQAKKRTATLGCDCVSIVGASLGGGHGREQGIYGLVSDQIISMTLVTANGSIVNASARENADLFWALRGAGHNFGVVVEIMLQLYDTEPGWGEHYFIADYFFRREQLNEIVEALNTIIFAPQNPELNIFAWFRRQYIHVSVQYGGRQPVWELIAQIIDLKPYYTSEKTVPWPLVPAATGLGLANRSCNIRSDEYYSSASVMMTALDSATIRDILTLADNVSTKNKASGIGQRSFFFVELYGRGKFEETKMAESSIYGHRDMRAIGTFETSYRQAHHVAAADSFINTARDLLLKHQQQERVYINYANGNEGALAWYGNTSHLARLQNLKREYDPEGVFSTFSPIPDVVPFTRKNEL
ncbi:hypothetical protein F5884DRAFT_889003 [Xylogone sp. PMI_703]|nr:hypothetical protein F5884DRAFT_889003 [Xylogone sp. PMI_703]